MLQTLTVFVYYAQENAVLEGKLSRQIIFTLFVPNVHQLRHDVLSVLVSCPSPLEEVTTVPFNKHGGKGITVGFIKVRFSPD